MPGHSTPTPSFRSARGLLLVLPLLLAPLGAQEPPQLPDFDRRTPVVLAVENVGPAVVNLRTLAEDRRRVPTPFGYVLPPRQRLGQPDEDLPSGFRDQSVGSGVIIHPDGYLVTNDHVIHEADRTLAYLADGRKIEARVINSSPDADLAILKLESDGPFPYAVLGSSRDTLVGEKVIAIGNPFGLSSSVTSGILSAKERPIPVGPHNETRTVMQTSALINPGNSGGPLCDINGRVIGINVAIDRRGPGIGYAIPIDRVKEVATELLSPELSRQLTNGIDPMVDGGGLLVEHVQKNSPAARSGLRVGDRILEVGGQTVATPLEYHLELQRFPEGAEVPLVVLSDGQRSVHRVALAPVSLEQLLGDSVSVLGLDCRNLSPAAAQRLDLRIPEERFIGVLVTEVAAESSADRIGIEVGDVVYQLGRARTQDVERLRRVADYYLERRSVRNRLPIYVYRKGRGAMQGTLTLDAARDEAEETEPAGRGG